MSEAALSSLQARIREAAAQKSPLIIRGGGTKDFYGMPTTTGRILDTTAYQGIIDYDPTELVITARAGTPISEIEQAMRGCGQMLACEPPCFGASATLGGMVATGLSGPRRPYAGSVRDIVLGVRVLDGKGDDLSFGGRVMKNVAGFDVARLMTGALGTLGVLTELSLKCLPLPKVEVTHLIECPVDSAIEKMNEWGGTPLPVSATCHYGGFLAVRLSGAAAAVDAASKEIGGEIVMDGESFWESVREHTHAHFAAAASPNAALWRLAVKSTALHPDLGGAQLIEWGGALRWLVAGERTDPGRVRAWAQGNGGHATLFRAADKSGGAFAPLKEPLLGIHRRLKAAFDPAGILNRGRLYPDL